MTRLSRKCSCCISGFNFCIGLDRLVDPILVKLILAKTNESVADTDTYQ